MTGRASSGPADRVVTAVSARRSTIVDVIRNARTSIALSLFRCNDAEIFAELARATARGVKIETVNDEVRRIFANVRSIARFIAAQKGAA